MNLEKLMTKSNKFDLYWDLAETASGLALVCFLWMHMLFVSTIIIGDTIFNNVPKLLEDFYLAQFGIPATAGLILVHMVLAGRRIPNAVSEIKIVTRHAYLLKHKDTWFWLIQVVTGAAMGILAAAHIWTVVSHWHINVQISAGRIQQTPYFLFYMLLLLLGEIHAGLGLYRIFVKWCAIERHKVERFLHLITAAIILLGFVALIVFKGIELTGVP